MDQLKGTFYKILHFHFSKAEPSDFCRDPFLAITDKSAWKAQSSSELPGRGPFLDIDGHTSTGSFVSSDDPQGSWFQVANMYVY